MTSYPLLAPAAPGRSGPVVSQGVTAGLRFGRVRYRFIGVDASLTSEVREAEGEVGFLEAAVDLEDLAGDKTRSR